SGHDRPAGEVPLEVLLVEAHRLDRVDFLVDAQVHDLVDEQQRIAVRQGAQDLRDVVSPPGALDRGVLAHGLPSSPGLSGPGPAWPERAGPADPAAPAAPGAFATRSG